MNLSKLPVELREAVLMHFQWWKFPSDPRITCQLLHPGTSCHYEFIKKIRNVVKNNWIFYMVLHVVPFILFRMKKLNNKTKKDKMQILLNLARNYAGSLTFMGLFVGILKITCCVVSKMQTKAYPQYIAGGAAVSSLTIFFQQKSRSLQIALFVFSRAFTSVYKYLNKHHGFNIPYVGEMCFVTIFGLVSMLYYQNPNALKYKQLVDELLGEH